MELTEKQLTDIINKTVEETVNALQHKKIIKMNSLNAKEKTEKLLYNYENFCRIVTEKQEKIDEIRECGGLHQKSKSFVNFIKSDGMRPEVDVEDIINTLQHSIDMAAQLISIIDMALDTVSDDEYFDCIKYKYFKSRKKMRREIAEIFDCDEAKITKKTNEMVNKITQYLFTNDVIIELLSA